MSNEVDNVSNETTPTVGTPVTPVETPVAPVETPVTPVETPVVPTTPVDSSVIGGASEPNSSNAKNKMPMIIGGIVALLAIVLGGLYFYFGSAKVIMTNVVSKVFDGASDMVDNEFDFDIEKNTISMSGDLGIDTNIDAIKDFSKEKVGFNFGLDYKNKKIEAGASLTENKKELINAMVYMLNKKMYLKIDGIDKLIDMGKEFDFDEAFDLEDFQESMDEMNFSREDVTKLIEHAKDITIASIDMDAIEKSSDTIKIDGKETKVNKLTYNLNSKNAEKFIKNIINNMREDDEFIKILAKMTDSKSSDIKSSLKDASKDIGDVPDLGKLYIYTKGLTNSFAGAELKVDGATIRITEGKDSTDFEVKADEVSIKLSVKEYSDEKMDIDYSINIKEMKFNGNVLVTCKETKKNNYDGKIQFSYNDSSKNKLTVTMNYKMVIDAKIADVNTKKAVDVEDLTTSDQKKLEEIIKNIEKSDIYELVDDLTSTIGGSSSSSYYYDDDDYDWDYDYSDYYTNDDNDDSYLNDDDSTFNFDDDDLDFGF